jgi:hypothetical protein
MQKFELIKASDLMKQPMPPMTLDAVLDAMLTYCPPYMHGLPKKGYIHFLELEIKRQYAKS